MDFNLDVRLKQLESLEQYISSSRDKVQSVLNCLKWNAKEVMKDSHLVRCSVDINHRVHAKSSDEHIKKCQLRSEGYSSQEEFLSESVEGQPSCITIDHYKKMEILSTAHRSIPDFKSAWNGQDPDPKTADRLICTFSPDERLALYNYTVDNTIGPPELPEFNTVQPVKSGNESPSYAERRMQERDAKRRRIKYKTVYTNHKSHKEILHEVIEKQMGHYVDWLFSNNLVPDSDKGVDAVNNTDRSEHSCDSYQKSGHSSVADFGERTSIVSRISTYSSDSRSTFRQERSRDRYEDSHKRYKGDYDHGVQHRSKKHFEHRRSRSRSRSRSRHNDRKHRNNYRSR